MATTPAPPIDPSTALSIFQTAPHTFLQPTTSLHNSFLNLAKRYLDPLAADITATQEARQKAERASRKRKRRRSDDGGGALLKMRKVYVEGFEVGQVWQQVRRVLEAAGEEVVRDLPAEESDDQADAVDVGDGGRATKIVRFQDGGLEAGGSEGEMDEDYEDLGEEGVDYEVEGEDDGEDIDAEDGQEMADGLSDEGSVDIGEETPPSEISDDDQPQRPAKRSKQPTMVKDKFGLNDGFFSIDDFNKQSQFMEQADAKGEDDGAASDEEDVDWTVDPSMSNLQPAPQSKEGPSKNKRPSAAKKTKDVEDMSDEDGDDEGGPTFGNMDLNAPEDDSDMEDFDDKDLNDEADGLGFSNTNEVMYKDFFEPPASSKRKKPRRSKLSAPETSGMATEDDLTGEGQDAQTQRAISSIQRDLFDDDLSSEDDPDLDREPQDSSLASNRNLSTHERRQLALREEIRKLEAANVAPKSWDLAGETLAPARPENSLLEADLEFDRAGKPVPIITDSVNEDIEALIKRRILNREFDEVVRRRPTDLVTGQAQRRRGLAELPDTKSSKGLAEEYEDEHLRKTDPNYMDQRSEALKAKHDDIEKHWRAISGQLDALCNMHHKPRPAQENIEVRVDAPRITMEEARPSVAGAGGDESVLAPQELYKADEEGKQRGETMTKGGLSIAKEEESREQKKRRKRREKERMRKAGGNAVTDAADGVKEKASDKGRNKKDRNEDVVRQLEKGGVKVIDKKGELKDVQGQAVRENGAVGGAGRYKL